MRIASVSAGAVLPVITATNHSAIATTVGYVTRPSPQ